MQISLCTSMGKDFGERGRSKDNSQHVGAIIDKHRNTSVAEVIETEKDPKHAILQRLNIVSRVMNSFKLPENAAVRGEDTEGAENERRRWIFFHSARYLLSPHADAYRGSEKGAGHGKKSQILHALSTVCFGGVQESVHTIGRTGNKKKSMSSYFDYDIPPFASVMDDIMNHVWKRCSDVHQGNSIFLVMVVKNI